ncbi:hypothetical protein CLU79DRAFT_846939 [Phycomyces nitens]|nr:hypothetical protein CLU79DRAFT_846939 [Phycomyces nitens]
MKDTICTNTPRKSLETQLESLGLENNQDIPDYCPHSRSYSQIIRDLDAAHRIEIYQKLFQMYQDADPKLRKWIRKVDKKGLPGSMTQGYRPPQRPPVEQVMPTKRNSGVFDRMSGSVSTLFRKAAASMPRPQGPRTGVDPTPKSSSSRFLANSLGHLGFSKSLNMPSKSETICSTSYRHIHRASDGKLDEQNFWLSSNSESTKKSSSHSHTKNAQMRFQDNQKTNQSRGPSWRVFG